MEEFATITIEAAAGIAVRIIRNGLLLQRTKLTTRPPTYANMLAYYLQSVRNIDLDHAHLISIFDATYSITFE